MTDQIETLSYSTPVYVFYPVCNNQFINLYKLILTFPLTSGIANRGDNVNSHSNVEGARQHIHAYDKNKNTLNYTN